MITIIDYGTSNLGSIRNMLSKIGVENAVASDPESVGKATKIILPGVGAFDAGMTKLAATGMVEALNERVLGQKVPVLGVCLGMQLMARGSEEGNLPGLGWIGTTVRRFDQVADPGIRVPHMGWNEVSAVASSPLIADLPPEARFYFAHSYRYSPDEVPSILVSRYGRTAFTSAFHSGNIYGAQFHPEKSHRFGMWLLSNFAKVA
jgi:glutamine amidotransferase